MHLELAALVVDDYDRAIDFVEQVGFELVEDSSALTNDGRPKRWVVVRPPGTTSGSSPATYMGHVDRVGSRWRGHGRRHHRPDVGSPLVGTARVRCLHVGAFPFHTVALAVREGDSRICGRSTKSIPGRALFSNSARRHDLYHAAR